jgi:DNA primase
MALYTADSKDRVRDAVDFVDLVGQYTELRRSSANRFTGLCPFHEERTPSFGIEPEQKLYKCFGCGEGGDVFHFVQLKEGLDFRGAIEFLADRYGVELQLESEDPQAAAQRQARERLLELLDRTATFYARHLWESPEAATARGYLAQRGLDEGMLREFRVGYAPSAWDTVLLASRRSGFSNRELHASGLAQRSKSTGGLLDRFRRRIMFPLCDRRGRVLGFGARAVSPDQQPKYLNSSDGEVFHKGQHVYAADIARAHAAKAGTVILAEGYTDVIALHQAGLRNTVGLMGTALTDQQVTELSQMAPTVVLALDADSAGQEAMLRAARVAAGRKLELRVVALPAGSDPADIATSQGPAAIRSLVQDAVPFVRFRVDRELAQNDLTSAEGKDRAIAALRPVFATLPPSALREDLTKLVADRTNLAPSMVSSWLADANPRGGGAGAGAPAGPGAPPMAMAPAGRVRLDPTEQAERAFLAQCLALPDAGTDALNAMDLEESFSSPLYRRAAAHLRAHASDPGSGLDSDDHELGSLIAELSVLAAEQHPSRAVLDAELLKLRLAHLDRRIALATTAGKGDVEALAGERTGLRRAVDAAIDRAMHEASA